MFEFETALHHWISRKRTRRLVVLMMLDSPTDDLYADEASDTAVLRHYLHQYTYIDYTWADDWMDRLLYALPLHGMDQQRPAAHNDHVELLCDNNANDLVQ